ncbi:MAG: C1 family peptidase, partial [Pseudomonadota bacterium]
MANSKYVTKTRAAGQQRVLNVRPDTPDIRDRYYAPAMLQLKDSVFNDGGLVLDQGTEGACTGFALAAVINLLNMKRGEAFSASPRMLYEMARKHDEWPGEDYQGSSCRGAIRGWRNMGVCSSRAWPYKPDSPGTLTIDRAMAARHNPLGAYYRLRPDVVDYHAALNEVDAIYVSARVHDGWSAPQVRDDYAVIQPGGEPTGGHAFALVGYNHLGFLVQNSWGEDWGKDGFAIWLYEDWQAHVSDGWVFRLGIATPTIFSLRPRPRSEPDEAELVNKGPKRHRIAGHFAHFDDGHYQTHGNYWTTAADLRQTARRLADNRDWYQHVLVFVHGGLNSPKSSARRIAALKDGFTRNRIYPLHIMYDTGLAEEIRDTLGRVSAETEERAEGFVDWV